jgi:ferredoxin-like protein FixX
MSADLDECPHDHVERDDDGLSRYFHRCLDCGQELVLSEPDEDGQSTWEAIE